MGKQWVRAQVKHNEIQDAMDRAIRWIAQNRQAAGIAAGSTAAVLLFAGLFLYSYRSKQNAAWDEFSMANGYAYGGQTDVALKKVDELTAQYPSTVAAGYGLVFAGDILFHRERFAECEKYYKQLMERGQPQVLLPFALGGLVAAQEAEGRCPDAVASGERFLATYPDHFLAPQVHTAVARCQAASGHTDTAKATLQKIVLQYPETTWAVWAQERLKALGGGA